jgi:pheromone a factor receptor
MAVIVLLLYMPLLCYFFYIDWPAPFYPYSFKRVHGPLWNVALFLHIDDYPEFQYLNWSPVALGFLIFFFYGVTTEAINRYREGLLKLGLGHLWPVLKEPYVPSRSKTGSTFSTSRSSWLQKFDVMSKAVNYMDSRKDAGSQENSTQTGSSVRYDSSSSPHF